MIRMHKVLAPTDFSESSKRALRYAVSFAQEYGAELTVLHVVDVIYYDYGWMYGGVPMPDRIICEHDENVKSELERFVNDCDRERVSDIKLEIAHGQPYREIIRYARSNEMDLVVLATHGRMGLSHLFLGSVAEKVVRGASCPVLTVHPGGRDLLSIDEEEQVRVNASDNGDATDAPARVDDDAPPAEEA